MDESAPHRLTAAPPIRSASRLLAASILAPLLLGTVVLAGTGWAAEDQAHPAVTLAPARQAKPRPYSVVVLGDGFADALAEGLTQTFANQPDVAILQKTHAPFGLSQNDKFDWVAAIRALLAAPERIDAAVIMLGANDTVPLKDGGNGVEPQSARWRTIYGDRVEAVAHLFRDKAIPLIWVGLPVVQNEELSAQFVALNELLRERATKAGATYVDSWDAFVDENGKYSGSGPDVNGQAAKLRASDGIDFTQAGTRKLASFVEADLRRDRDKAKPDLPDPAEVVIPTQPDFDNALNIDVNAQIRRELGLPALPTAPGAGQPPRAPQIGPVIAITAPVLAADGHLVDSAGKTTRASGPESGSLAERALVQGQPIQPRPSRIDDFSWPKP
jgi:uncharacterized protein